MVMAFKHQVVMSKNPDDLIFITLNHLDAIMDYAKSASVKKNVAFAYELLIQGIKNLFSNLLFETSEYQFEF